MSRPKPPDRETRRAVLDLLHRGPASTFLVVSRVSWQGAERALVQLEADGFVSCDRTTTPAGPHVWSLTEKAYGAGAP